MKILEIDCNNSNTLAEWYCKKYYFEFYEYITELYKDHSELKWQEKLYWYFNNISEHPKCITCGNPTKFMSFKKGYKQFCSGPCVSKSDYAKQKAIQTSLIKYGTTNPSKNKDIKNRIKNILTEKYGGIGNEVQEFTAKAKQTKLERYGDENFVNSEKTKQTKLERYGDENYTNREKSKQTKLERYGDENFVNSEKARMTCLERYGGQGNEVQEFIAKAKKTKLERYGDENYTNREKSKQTCIDHYGVCAPVQNPIIKQKIINSRNNFILKTHQYIDNILRIDDKNLYVIKCPHPNCDKCLEKIFTIGRAQYWNRVYNNIELCTNIYPISKSHIKDTGIEKYIQEILNRYNIEYECNNRKVLFQGKELDIYIPSKKLAIECNGIFWHSSTHKENNYHYNKWIECNQNDIQLLTLWEDQIVHKPEIIESIILSKLGIYNERIGARKCVLKEVSNSESVVFLNENHLQGSVNSRVRLGLYYNNELVSLMTFGSKRKCMNGRSDQWELHRYCNKRGIQVIGGASKLFKYFIDTYKPTSIESFSSNDISNGELYRQLGFNNNGSQYGSYWYIEPKTMIRNHRFNFRKDVLVKEGYDPAKSETQIMLERGYYKIYDSGQSKWVYRKKENLL